jgi:hypothetical protein
MKDMRGSHVSAIRTAILKTSGLHLLASNKRKNSKDILEWKQSKEVKDIYNKLFTQSTMIENITNSAFPSLHDAGDERFNDMYIYTASVCDIILNPDYPTLEVSKKPLELRLKRFRVFIEFILLFKN